MELLLFLWFSLVCWNGCESEYIKPTFFYEAAFDPAMVDEAEAFMKETGKKWRFELHADHEFVTFGEEAFFIECYAEDELILIITNAGVGTVLTLALFENENVPRSELERLSQEVRDGLTKELGIEFKVAEP